jgi:hypothetical protein
LGILLLGRNLGRGSQDTTQHGGKSIGNHR